jgi:hypothetical protein
MFDQRDVGWECLLAELSPRRRTLILAICPMSLLAVGRDAIMSTSPCHRTRYLPFSPARKTSKYSSLIVADDVQDGRPRRLADSCPNGLVTVFKAAAYRKDGANR